MGTNEVDGRYYPTWKLADGACRESLAFEVARKEGVPADVVDRAEELCVTKMLYPNGLHAANQDDGHALEKEAKRIDDERYEQSFVLSPTSHFLSPSLN
jgi:dsDNA-specific endonuclease/ATPase MutS2